MIGLSLLLASCGGDSGDDDLSLEAPAASTTTNTATPSCDEARHAVVLSTFGAATLGDEDEAGRWSIRPEEEPVPRPGAADIVRAYKDLGYQILYVTLQPSEMSIGDQQLIDAVTVWLGANGFPVGSGETRVWAWDGNGEASVALIEELAHMSSDGTDVDVAYVSDSDLVFPLVTGGVPRERVYTLGEAADQQTVTSLPDEDLTAHLGDIKEMDPVCE